MHVHPSRINKGRGRPSKFDLPSLICRSNISSLFTNALWNLIEPHEQQRLMQYLPECDLIMETMSPSYVEETIEVDMEVEEKNEAFQGVEGEEKEGVEGEEKEGVEGEGLEEEDGEAEILEVENDDGQQNPTSIPLLITPPVLKEEEEEEEEINVMESNDEKEETHLSSERSLFACWDTPLPLEPAGPVHNTVLTDTLQDHSVDGLHPGHHGHDVPVCAPMDGAVEEPEVSRGDPMVQDSTTTCCSTTTPQASPAATSAPARRDPTDLLTAQHADLSFSTLSTVPSPTLPDSTRCTLRPHIFSTPSFRQSLLVYQDYLITGRLAKVLESCHYASQLSVAEIPFMRERMDGVEDLDDEEWKDANFESYWGQLSEQKKQFRNSQVAGASAQIKLQDLIKKGMLKPKDILVYDKWFEVLQKSVHEEYQVMSVDPKSDTLYTRLLPGHSEYIFSGLNHLETVSFREVAGSEGIRKPNGNAWKCTYRKRPGHPDVSFFKLRKEYMALYLNDEDH